MVHLTGTYTALPNKRLVILASPDRPVTGLWADDINTLTGACATDGHCDVRFQTPYGQMAGTLMEKNPRQARRRSFEGHVWFVHPVRP